MMDKQALRSLLKRKQPQSTEIEVHLFEYCNLSCTFCGQDHNSKLGFDTVGEKADQVIAFMKKNYLNDHIINVMGGELFNDLIPEHLFTDYKKFAIKIFTFAKENNQKVTLNWVTNLIFLKKERVLNLLNKLKNHNFPVNISTSYDFQGRGYAGNTNSLFAKNLSFFKEYIYTIGFVLTKPSIKNFLEREDIFFEKLYQKFPLYFDYYVPEEKNCEALMPSDQELLDVFIYIARKYPNISPIKDWVANEMNQMTCYSLNKITIQPSGEIVTCRYVRYKKNRFHNAVDYKSNDNIIASYIDKNECLQCEFFNRCGLRCFVQADWVKRDQLDSCLYKIFFRSLQSNFKSI